MRKVIGPKDSDPIMRYAAQNVTEQPAGVNVRTIESAITDGIRNVAAVSVAQPLAHRAQFPVDPVKSVEPARTIRDFRRRVYPIAGATT